MKSISLFILFAFSITTLAQAQEDTNFCHEEFDGGFCLVKVNGKVGVRKKNKYVIPAFFDEIVELDNNAGFMVTQYGKKGVFDKKGKMVVPVMYQQIDASRSSDHIYEVMNSGLRAVYINKELNKLFGYLRISNTLFAAQTETSIEEYLAYLQLIRDRGEEFDLRWENFVPDTNQMPKKCVPAIRYFLQQEEGELAYHKYTAAWYSTSTKLQINFGGNYLADKEAVKLLSYPISGVTVEQVKGMCKLKSLLFTEEINSFEGTSLAIRFRLPTVDEWEQMAIEGLSEDMKKRKAMDSTNVKGCQLFQYKFNFTCESIETMKKLRGGELVFVYDYFPSLLGLYNTFGNVAEMVNESGYCKGGSYSNWAAETKIDNTIKFEGAKPWVGFRYVAELYVKY